MNDPLENLRRQTARWHLLLGWWGLFVFLSLGIVLETLHAYKVSGYLDPEHRLRRLLWTLAHAHGTLLSLIQLCFAATVEKVQGWGERRLRLVSFLLLDALVLLPLGFFLGGVGHTEVDPSFWVLLVPLGALALLLGVGLTAWTLSTGLPADVTPTEYQGPQEK